MLKIGLTGGIASGKSTVTEWFLEQGVKVLDADKIVRDLQQPNTVLLKQLAQTFGTDVIEENGHLNRALLGRLIFENEEAKRKLNDIMKPLIYQKLVEGIEEAKRDNEAMVVLDMPLLYEFEFEHLVDTVVVVHVNRLTQVKRLMQRDQIEESYAKSKINSQMSLDEKRSRGDFVLTNEGSIEELKTQFKTLYAHLEEIALTSVK